MSEDALRFFPRAEADPEEVRAARQGGLRERYLDTRYVFRGTAAKPTSESERVISLSGLIRQSYG
jgi:hypothetical protein